MLFDLRQLGRKGSGTLRDEHVDRTFQPSDFPQSVVEDEEYKVIAPVHLVMDVHKDGEAYRVAGTVSTRLQLQCGRCLESFEIPVDSPFELRYVPEIAPAVEGEEREVTEDDLTTSYYKEDSIDLSELMHEQFVLALPMKPLCSEACKGLCVHCGANLNKDTCDCNPTWTDPRLGALKGIFTDTDTSKRAPEGEPEGPRARSEVRNEKGPTERKYKEKRDTSCRILNAGTRRPGPPSAAPTTRSSRSAAACARSARQPSSRTSCAPIAATTPDGRSRPSKSSDCE
jgi:Predicted metal-binding, possibly nucleic acid-binding protein